ncbi:MAG TPA: hypothetical protein ENI90_04445 [Methylothermaceae bacterium]|nr:hypothetical protein [Methylothermaceae bacterium]
MMGEETFNLDKLTARWAQEMVSQAQAGVEDVKKPVDTLERLATKTLGVLQEQGVYAMMLFLFSRTSDEAKVAESCIRPQLYQVLREIPSFEDKGSIPNAHADARTALKFYTDKVLDDLDTLLLVRDLYEQTLIYARYGAKAAGGET